MQVQLLDHSFSPYPLLAEFEQQLPKGQFGASCHFVGTMRDFNLDHQVDGMFLEHYPGMTEKQLSRIANHALAQWDILDALLVHRVGHILPGENIVVTAAWAAHRQAAFEACRYLIETLKSEAPFWKKEQRTNSTAWVANNT